MARSVVVALLGAAAAVGALQACGSGPGREDVAIQRLVTVLCEKARECGCELLLFDDRGQPLECGDWPVVLGYDFEDTSRATLAFDPACVEPWTSWYEELSCQVPVIPRYADLCPLYHGTLREGDACEQPSPVDTDCGPGLFCVAGTCRDPLRTAFGELGEPCELGRRCAGDLACVSSLCQRLPGPGEPCLEGYLCNAESRCSFERCVELPGPGEPCVFSQCEPGAFCVVDPSTGDEECRRAADVGDPCMGHRECTSGNCPAGFCEDPADVGDPCGSQLPCGPGLACVDGQCQSAGDGAASVSTCDLLDVL